MVRVGFVECDESNRRFGYMRWDGADFFGRSNKFI
jgi:hypothetical protein